MVLDKEKRIIGVLALIITVLVALATVPASSMALTPKYFPVHRNITSIEDFMWPVEIKSNSKIKINVTTTDGWLEIGYIIPAGFTSRIYFKNALTGKVYYGYNYSGKGEEGGALHGYIKGTDPCIIGLDGVGTVDLMYFPILGNGESIESNRNITSYDAEYITFSYHVPNPAYFKFKTPKDICVYSFSYSTYSGPFELIDMDENNATTKTVEVEEDGGDVSALGFAFFVFYNRSGGPVHDVKLIDYGPYTGGKSLPAIYGLIPLSLILIAVGVTWYWIKRK